MSRVERRGVFDTGFAVADPAAVAVGLPDVGKVTQTATYTDTKIRHTTRDMPVGEIVHTAEPGVGVVQQVRSNVLSAQPECLNA